MSIALYRLHLKSNHDIGLCHAAQNFQKAKENVAKLLDCSQENLVCSLIAPVDARFFPTFYYPKNRRD